MFKLGIVIQYFEKTSMALAELDNNMALGDRIVFVKEGEEIFKQKVELLQIGHQKLDSANRGSMVLLRVNEKVEKDWEIFKKSGMD